MYDPSKYGEQFGSELRRRQTPALAKRKRRQALISTAVFIFVGVGCLIEAVGAIRTGKMVSFGRRGSLPITGYEEALIALFLIVICGLGFWRTLRNR